MGEAEVSGITTKQSWFSGNLDCKN